ncbi:MAG: alpha-glucosidase [Oscillospiraceae bacterium]|nr:alpha-glucosidase [Oscillospiraceae bacterium]
MTEPFTLNSKIKDLYKSPIGHDIVYKILLQMGMGEWVIQNPIVGNLRLKTLSTFTKKSIGPGFFNTLINLLNNEKDVPLNDDSEIVRKWWKEAVFYQIYPKSFMDLNGDGIGDLRGIISKLDYIKDLGVDAIWLCPIYDSPFDDNGYDIRDYYKISDVFGTMDDFDELLSKVHRRGIKLIMDLVVNHTSDEHQWFKGDHKDFYFIKESKGNNPPNNWTSYFGGSAWNKYDDDKWGLHLFSKKQMDLNWDNAELRREVYKMINFWLGKGVDGFRLDVINYISKTKDLPDGDEFVGKLMGFCGIEHYFYGPKLHEYLKEMRKETFDKYDAFSVGETPGVGIEMSKLLTSDYRKELDMVFSFDLLETPGHGKFDDYIYDLNYLKHYMIEWMENYGNHCFMSIFYDNHDNPRMLSKVDPSLEHRAVLAKLLAIIQFTLKGTPFLYQGQELGAVNKPFKSMDELRDIESINLYESLKGSIGEKEAFKKILSGTRDHSRVPMQWNNEKNGGFSKGTPWINAYLDSFNALDEEKDIDSILNFYREIIYLRKNSEALKYGDIEFRYKKHKNLFVYTRKINDEAYFIECNLSRMNLKRPYKKDFKERVLSNYKDDSEVLRPFEGNVYKVI